jgi:SAM-dependent methyltransferase
MVPMNEPYERYVEFKQWEKQSFGEVKLSDYYDGEIGRAFGTVPGPGRLKIVEIGFGNGEFLGWARLRGNHAVGVEVIEELNQRAKDAGFDTAPSIDALLMANASAYDLVAAFDVLEHIEPRALVELLNKVHTLLRPGGILLASFPNGDSPFGLRYQYGDLTHRTVLSEGSVAQLLQQTPFKSFRLCEPCIVRKGITGFAKKMIKLPLQICMERVFRHLYYGREMPPTLAMNYVLLASK